VKTVGNGPALGARSSRRLSSCFWSILAHGGAVGFASIPRCTRLALVQPACAQELRAACPLPTKPSCSCSNRISNRRAGPFPPAIAPISDGCTGSPVKLATISAAKIFSVSRPCRAAPLCSCLRQLPPKPSASARSDQRRSASSHCMLTSCACVSLHCGGRRQLCGMLLSDGLIDPKLGGRFSSPTRFLSFCSESLKIGQKIVQCFQFSLCVVKSMLRVRFASSYVRQGLAHCFS